MGNSGWIKLDRQIIEHPLWCEDRFSKGQAWVDLLLMVNHEDRKTLVNGNLVVIKKGQHLTSIRKLSARWGWHEETVLKFLRLLEQDGMIRRDSRTLNGTLLTVVNWAKFQDGTNTLPNTKPNTEPNTKPNTDPSQTRKNKNDKERKEYIAPQSSEDDEDDCYTQEEYDELCRQWRIDHGIV